MAGSSCEVGRVSASAGLLGADGWEAGLAGVVGAEVLEELLATAMASAMAPIARAKGMMIRRGDFLRGGMRGDASGH